MASATDVAEGVLVSIFVPTDRSMRSGHTLDTTEQAPLIIPASPWRWNMSRSRGQRQGECVCLGVKVHGGGEHTFCDMAATRRIAERIQGLVVPQENVVRHVLDMGHRAVSRIAAPLNDRML